MNIAEPMSARDTFIEDEESPIEKKRLYERGLTLALRSAERGSAAEIDAWNDIYAHYNARLIALVRRNGGKSYAEDIVQETFHILFKNLDKIDPNKELLNWLFTVAQRITIDYLRKVRRRGGEFTSTDDYIPELVAAKNSNPEPSPLEDVIAEERRDWARVCIDLLDEQDRQLIDMYYADDLPYLEIGRRIGTHGVTVARRLVVSEEKFRKLYAMMMSS